MSRQPRGAPPAQYGIVEADENPFDDGPMVSHSPAPPRQQPRQQQPPRQSGGNGQQPRSSSQGAPSGPARTPSSNSQNRQPQYAQPAEGQPQYAQPPRRQPAPAAQPQASSPTNETAAMTGAAAAGAGAAAAAPKKSGFASITSIFGGGGNTATTTPEEDVATREANLRAREEKMAQMEMEVERRERAVKAKEGAMNNWPSRCYPILYHSIADEIPTRLQPMVKKLYYLCLFTWIALFWNVVSIATTWGETGSDNGLIWSLIYLGFGPPCSFVLWYRQVYYASSQGASRRYLYFFVVFGIHILFCVYIGLGTPSAGAGGLLLMIKAFANSAPVSGIFCLIDSAFWTINLFISIYLMKLAHSAWRSGGGSEDFKKDQAKFKFVSKAGLAAV